MDDRSTHNKANIWQNELWTVKEVAAYLRVGRITIWRWCQQGILPAARIGRNWRIHREDLVGFLEKGHLPISDSSFSEPAVDEADGQTPHLLIYYPNAAEIKEPPIDSINDTPKPDSGIPGEDSETQI
jgi:excisionase family DNA binding protein